MKHSKIALNQDHCIDESLSYLNCLTIRRAVKNHNLLF
jgi:hypothetical protein